MTRIVGIDLGTTNSCVAIVEEGKPRVIPNKQGYATTPSVIAVTEDGTRVVGQLAVRQAVTNPRNTVYGAKRLIGRTFTSEEVQHAAAHVSYEVVEGPNGDARIMLRDKSCSIPELSAIILQEMRLVAEDHLGEPVDRAVVTVPAYFNDNQRQAVRDAGRIAGLDVVRILNEPTSAALAYGFDRAVSSTLAVYDLGGGTFDVSIVRIDEHGDFHVVATTGDSYLGGEDFDERIMDYLTQGFLHDHGVDLSESPQAVARLRQAAQQAKVELSAVAQVDVSIPFIAQNRDGKLVHLEYELKREKLESLTADLVTQTLSICELALDYAKMQPDAVDEVILVGGMTRMPAVQRAVAGYFGREPKKGVHPDEVVALGAAIAGDALAGGAEVKLHDVTAHSLGIMTAGGGFDPLITANTTVPIRRKEIFGTSRDGQNTVKIVVLQGESTRAAENDALGRFALTGLREAAAGEVQVEVTFTINQDGIFSVGARDLETGEERMIDVLASSGLSDEEVEAMMQDSAAYLAERRAEEATETHRQACQYLLEAIRARLPIAEKKMAWTPIGADAIKKARQAVDIVERAMPAADPATLLTHKELLSRVEAMLERVMSEVGG